MPTEVAAGGLGDAIPPPHLQGRDLLPPPLGQVGAGGSAPSPTASTLASLTGRSKHCRVRVRWAESGQTQQLRESQRAAAPTAGFTQMKLLGF